MWRGGEGCVSKYGKEGGGQTANERQRWEGKMTKRTVMVGREEVLAARCQSRVVGVASRNHTTRLLFRIPADTTSLYECMYGLRTTDGTGRLQIMAKTSRPGYPSFQQLKSRHFKQIGYSPGACSTFLAFAIANHGCAQRSGERRRRLFLSLSGASGSRLRPERVISLKVHDPLPHRRRRQLNRNGYHHDQKP